MAYTIDALEACLDQLEDSNEFRDAVIELCDLTRTDKPSDEDWDAVRKRVKKLAAAYALRRRRQRQTERLIPEKYELYTLPFPSTTISPHTTTTSGTTSTYTYYGYLTKSSS